MIFHRHTPAFPLSQFIESFVYYKGYDPEHSVDRFLPDGYVYVVIDLTDYPKFIYDNHTLKEIQSCKNVWFSGIREKYITIPSGRDSEMFIIYFRKGMAYPFVEMPMHELTDFVVDGELVMTGDILNLREALLSCVTIQEKCLLAEQYLMRGYAKKLEVNPFISYAVKSIIQHPGQASLTALSAQVGYTRKHMIHLFKQHVGLTPKAFMRVMRFQKAIAEISAGKFTGWTEIAYQSGYFDQAHFIHDFKAFSGFTPGQYLSMQSAYTNYVAVG